MGDVVDLFGQAASKARHGCDGGPGPAFYDPASSAYKAYGAADSGPWVSLMVILRDGSATYCQYAHMESAYPDGNTFTPSAAGRPHDVITLRFGCRSGSFLVIIKGLRLHRMWELLMGHDTHWICELPAHLTVAGDHAAVIRSITFKELA